ncbi:MAG: DUF4433 domain-containing protein, partial [Candidatus Altiarchaeota archaeon]|nr:DUF4433 domain-containing protein [Candidatus Altiarchaeota archaeon]
MKENEVTVKAYKDAIEEIAEKERKHNSEYFSVREIESLLGVEVIPVTDELFEALEQLGLEYSATICPMDLQIYLEVPKTSRKIEELKIPPFYHITHIDNINSIIHDGLFCNNVAKEKRPRYTDISKSPVQDKRHNKTIGDLDIHSYVPLHVTRRNPMVCEVIKKYGRKNLCFICINRTVLSRLGAYISDGNAASDKTKKYKVVDINSERLEEILRDVKNAEEWGRFIHSDKERYDELKRIKCAEVLVPFIVPASMF